MHTTRRTLLRRSFLAAPLLSANLFPPLLTAAEVSSTSEQWCGIGIHSTTSL